MNKLIDKLIILDEGIFVEEETTFDDIGAFFEDLRDSLKSEGGDSIIGKEFNNILLSIIPEDLEFPKDIGISFSNIAIVRPTKVEEAQVYFDFGWKEANWNVFPSHFEIKSLALSVGFIGKKAEALVTGIVDFNDYQLKATVELPALYLELKLMNPSPDAGHPSPLKLLENYNIESPGEMGASEIKISQFQISAYPRLKSYTLGFGMLDLPLYQDNFILDFDSHLAYTDGDVSGEFWTNFHFEGIKNVPSFSIPLRAEFSTSENAIRFEGGINLSEYNVLDVVEMIGKKMGMAFHFPSFFHGKDNELRVNYMAMGLDKTPAGYDFEFGLDLVNLIHIKHNYKTIFSFEELFVHINYANDEQEEKEFGAQIICYLSIFENKLIAEATKDSFGWQFIARTEEDEVLKLLSWLSDILEAGTGLDLPKGLDDFNLKNAEINYHTGTKAFSIKGETDGELEIPVIKNTIHSLKFSFSRNEKQETELYFSGNTSISYESEKSVDIEVKIIYENGSWIFDGRTELGEEIELGKMVEGVFSKTNVTLPSAIEDFSAKDIGIKYQSKDKVFHLSALVETNNFPSLGNTTSLYLDFNYTGSTSALGVSGNMTINDPKTTEKHQFLIAFGKAKTTKTFLATYQGSVTFQKIIGLFSSSLAESLPTWITPEMNGATFLISKNSSGESRVIFLLEGNIEFKLSELDLVGNHLPKEAITVELKMNIATGALPKEEVTSVQKLLADTGSKVVIPKEGQGKGFSLKTNITGSTLIPHNTGFTFEKISKGAKEEKVGEEPKSKTKWVDISKKFGPIFIKKIGVTLEEGKFKLLLDGGMSMGAFTFRLMDLAVRVPLSMPFDPSGIDFSLAGLELKYKTATASLSGAFLAQKVMFNGELVNGYFGEAALTLNDKSFKAIGSFINKPDHPSFFLYVVATLPIGGPNYFYVNGFALGFGINSRLNIPEIDGVQDFVLVKAAFNETQFSEELPESNLQLIQHDISPEVGAYWVAIGLKVMHVKILQSFFLATVSFGNRVEVNLLGLTKLVLPPPGDSIIKAELAIKASYVPDTGELSIEGRLTKNSYILSPDAHLTGGFAFFAWFKGEHAGDFVLSMGGYHPKFKKPAHYPTVPRLGLSWQVTNNILIKGGEYYALTPNSFMAGGRLEASANIGPIEAWFIAEAHFFVNFSPFQYSVNVSVAMGATFELDLELVTIRKTMSFSASLDLWGPPFAGRAVIDLGIIDFVVEFGPERDYPTPISWAEFQEQFLPPKDKTLLIDVRNGFVKDVSQDEFAKGLDWILNPSEMILSIETAIPAKKIVLGNNSSENKIVEIGIAPMDLKHEEFYSEVHIAVFKGENLWTDNFLFSNSYHRNEPKALWGKFMDKNMDGGKTLIKNALAGISIYPKPKVPAITVEFDIIDLIYGKPITSDLSIKEGLVPENKYADQPPSNEKVSSPLKKHITTLNKLGLKLDEPDQFTFSEQDDQWMEADTPYKTTGSIA